MEKMNKLWKKIEEMFNFDPSEVYEKIMQSGIQQEQKLTLLKDLYDKKNYIGHHVNLSYFPGGYRFSLVNCQAKWVKMNMPVMWVADTPEKAMQKFIDYVEKNCIDIYSMMGGNNG